MLKSLFLFILLAINPYYDDALKVIKVYGTQEAEIWKELVELEQCQTDSVNWGWQMSEIVKQALWIYHPEYYDGGLTIWDLNIIYGEQQYKIYPGLIAGLKRDALMKAWKIK